MLWFTPRVPHLEETAPVRQQWGYGLPEQAPHAPQPEKPVSARGTLALLRHLRGDVTGGFAAAVLTIPVSMGYGLLALSGLGDAFVSNAILAGLYAPVFGCLIALLLGANTTMIYSPRSLGTFLIGAVVLHSLAGSGNPVLQAAPRSTILAL